jgi:ribosomal protein L37AE/L43A
MGVKICPNCGGKVADARNDCPHCKFDFTSLKICPDCQEQIDATLSECPICGHIFEKETKDEVIQEPIVQQEVEAQQEAIVQQAEKVEQKAENSEELTCPYCNSTESMQLGNDLYLCTTCKSKFMDTRGLPTPPAVVKKVEEKTASVVEEVTPQTTRDKRKPKAVELSNKVQANKKTLLSGVCTTTNTVGLFLTIITIVTFVVGVVFLCFARAGIYYFDDYGMVVEVDPGPYIKYAFGGGKYSILCLLPVISTILFGICLMVILFIETKRKDNLIIKVIVDILSILIASVAIVFGFISYSRFWMVGGLIIVYSILVATSCFFVLLHLISLIICKIKERCRVKNK